MFLIFCDVRYKVCVVQIDEKANKLVEYRAQKVWKTQPYINGHILVRTTFILYYTLPFIGKDNIPFLHPVVFQTNPRGREKINGLIFYLLTP